MFLNIIFIAPTEKYIASYNDTVDEVAKEGKYLSTNKGFPLDSTESGFDIVGESANGYEVSGNVVDENIVHMELAL